MGDVSQSGVSLEALIMAELSNAYTRQMTAECIIGRKGEYFDGDEWERRADWWHGRCNAAEAQLAREMGL